jgi:hypothetical protein
MDDSGPSRTVPPRPVSLPSPPVINSLLQKRHVAALIGRFPHIKQRLDCLVPAAELSDVPSARPEILNLLGLSDVDISVGMLLRDLLVASSQWCQRTLLSLLETLLLSRPFSRLASGSMLSLYLLLTGWLTCSRLRAWFGCWLSSCPFDRGAA